MPLTQSHYDQAARYLERAIELTPNSRQPLEFVIDEFRAVIRSLWLSRSKALRVLSAPIGVSKLEARTENLKTIALLQDSTRSKTYRA